MSFSGVIVLCEGATTAWEVWSIAAAMVLVFFSGAGAYIRICYGEISEDMRRAGDLNMRELTALIPLALCALAGLWPGVTNALRTLL